MSIKGVLKVNREQVNKYQLTIQPGVGAIVLVSIGGLEQELDSTALPDGTVRSGGRGKPGETDIVQPAHHKLEVLAMELWWSLCKNTLPGYLKLGTLVYFNEYGLPGSKYTLPNIWIKKRKSSDMDLGNEGDMATLTWSISYDDVIPVP
jgi:hypothetical protein